MRVANDAYAGDPPSEVLGKRPEGSLAYLYFSTLGQLLASDQEGGISEVALDLLCT